MATSRKPAAETPSESETGGSKRNLFTSGRDKVRRASLPLLAFAEVLAGTYAMLITLLGIVFAIAYYTEGTFLKNNGHYYRGFHLYVYIVALIIVIYIIVMTVLLKFRDTTKDETLSLQGTSAEPETLVDAIKRKRRMRTGVYVIGDINDGASETSDGEVASPVTALPPDDDLHDEEAPLMYSVKWGHNLIIRIGIVVFGLSAVVLEMCRMVDYSHQHSSGFGCKKPYDLAVVVFRMLFLFAQIILLSIHHRAVINYRPILMKFALLHLVSTNLVTWISSMTHDAVEVFLQLEINSANLTNYTDASLVTRLCISVESIEMIASNYLTPLIIGYCLLSANMVYRMYAQIGHALFYERHLPEVWETERLDPGGKCRLNQTSSGVLLGVALFLATIIITGYHLYLQVNMNVTVIMLLGRIHMGCDLVLNIIGIVSLGWAFFQIRKLLFMTHGWRPGWTVMVITIGGFYMMLTLMLIALFRSVYDKHFGLDARVGIIGPLLETLQITGQYVFIYDALYRRLETVDEMPGKSITTFLVFVNLSMWLTTSFQLKASFGSVLFFKWYHALPWALMINTTLPLAMYFRFMTSVLLAEVLRRTYGVHYTHGRRKCCKTF